MLELARIQRSYGAVRALAGVDLEIRAGERHAIVGANGAGKSTCLRILCGADAPDEGEVRLDGRRVAWRSPHDARRAGVVMVPQETRLVPDLTVAENVVLGREPLVGRSPFVDRRAARRLAREALSRLGLEVDPDRRAGDLPVALAQAVEIAKALVADARVIALDEPTAALTPREAALLHERLTALAHAGAAIVYVSHRLEDVLAIADRVTVLRDGARVATIDADQATREGLVRMMAGEAAASAPREAARREPGPERLRAEAIATARGLRGVSLALRAGEIVGVAGLVGSGRTALLRALAGADPLVAGAIAIDARPVRLRSPRDAARLGLALVPEDRLREGLLLARSVRENLTLAAPPRLAAGGVLVRAGAERIAARAAAERVRLRAASLETLAGALSGGNQQKALLGRAIVAEARILLLDEPTRGVDVVAKEEIRSLLREAADAGAALLVADSEIADLLALADRVLVLRDGRLAGEALARADATPERVIDLATGGSGAPRPGANR